MTAHSRTDEKGKTKKNGHEQKRGQQQRDTEGIKSTVGLGEAQRARQGQDPQSGLSYVIEDKVVAPTKPSLQATQA